MPKKNNFLLVDLSEKKTKKLAETITSTTSRKILNYLAEKDHDTEANIAKDLKIPISTVHYHLQKLTEAKLIAVEEYHYSVKGREVNHYKLANKYIIIAPKKISGLKDKLKAILPVGIIALGIGAVIKFTQSTFKTIASAGSKVMAAEAPVREAVVDKAAEEVMYATSDAADIAAEPLADTVSAATEPAKEIIVKHVTTQPDMALWFLIGSFFTIILFLVIALIREWWKRK